MNRNLPPGIPRSTGSSYSRRGSGSDLMAYVFLFVVTCGLCALVGNGPKPKRTATQRREEYRAAAICILALPAVLVPAILVELTR